MRDGSPPTETRNDGFTLDQAASLGVILIGVLAVAVAPGPYTFLSCLIGVTLLVALLAFGRAHGATNGQRVAIAIGVGLCAVLISGVVVQGIHQLFDKPPRLPERAVQSDYVAYTARVLEYGERSAAWLGGIGAAIGVASASLVWWLTVGRSEWHHLTPWPPNAALNQLVAWWSRPPASPPGSHRQAAGGGQPKSRPRPARGSPARTRRSAAPAPSPDDPARGRRDSGTGEP
jgi:hypothetical protein